MAEELARDPRVTVLNNVVLNQVLVRFARDGANVTNEVIDSRPARGDVLDERHGMGGRAGDADLGMQLAHDRGRHPPLRHGRSWRR